MRFSRRGSRVYVGVRGVGRGEKGGEHLFQCSHQIHKRQRPIEILSNRTWRTPKNTGLNFAHIYIYIREKERAQKRKEREKVTKKPTTWPVYTSCQFVPTYLCFVRLFNFSRQLWNLWSVCKCLHQSTHQSITICSNTYPTPPHPLKKTVTAWKTRLCVLIKLKH